MLLFPWEAFLKGCAHTSGFLKQGRSLGIQLYVSAKRFISSEVEKQLKDAIGEHERNKDEIMGVYTCFYDIQTSHVRI